METVIKCEQEIQVGVQKSGNKQELFRCECGKEYLSFAAIYLHFRTKHDIKLSTKPTETRRKVIFAHGHRINLYLLKTSQYQIENKKYSLSSQTDNSGNQEAQRPVVTEMPKQCPLLAIKRCIDTYISQAPHSPKWIFRMLVQYMEKHWETMEGRQCSVSELPWCLNNFVVDYIPTNSRSLKVNCSTWKKLCSELLQFCQWLHSEKLTDLTVIYEADQTKNMCDE